jgi:hypothetical protein
MKKEKSGILVHQALERAPWTPACAGVTIIC